MTYCQHILYILSRLQKHYNKYNAEHSILLLRSKYNAEHSILLLCSSLNAVSSEHVHSVAGFEEDGAILLYNSSTSTSKKGKEGYEYKIITK